MLQGSDLVTKMRWVGHVQEIEKERGPRKVLEEKPGGRRMTRRPRDKWMMTYRMMGVQSSEEWYTPKKMDEGGCDEGG